MNNSLNMLFGLQPYKLKEGAFVMLCTPVTQPGHAAGKGAMSISES